MYGWSGMGDRVVIGADGQPRVVTDAPITTVTVPSSGAPVYEDEQGRVIFPSTIGGGSDITSWLNANAGKVALGVGGVFALMLLAKAGR